MLLECAGIIDILQHFLLQRINPTNYPALYDLAERFESSKADSAVRERQDP
jgi:hypothetical protein